MVRPQSKKVEMVPLMEHKSEISSAIFVDERGKMTAFDKEIKKCLIELGFIIE